MSSTLSCKVQISITHLKNSHNRAWYCMCRNYKEFSFCSSFLPSLTEVESSSLITWQTACGSASVGRCIYILQTYFPNAQLQAVRLHVRCQSCDNRFWRIVHRVAQCFFRSVVWLRELACLMRPDLMYIPSHWVATATASARKLRLTTWRHTAWLLSTTTNTVPGASWVHVACFLGTNQHHTAKTINTIMQGTSLTSKNSQLVLHVP